MNKKTKKKQPKKRLSNDVHRARIKEQEKELAELWDNLHKKMREGGSG